MIHDNRAFRIVDIESAAELAEKLTQHTWTLCSGWRHQARLYLNDSFTEDGAFEVAVVKDGIQIESITFGWMKEPEAFNMIQQIDSCAYDNQNYGTVEVKYHPEGTCRYCQ